MNRILVGGLILGVFCCGSIPAAAATQLDRRFETSDGTFSFRYPSAWSRRTSDGYVSVLRGIGPPRNGHLEEGEAKVEFYIRSAVAGETLERLKKEECVRHQSEGDRMIDCRITTFNGRPWMWGLKFADALGGNWLRVTATIENGRVYRGVAIVPDGTGYREGLAITKTILLSVHVSRAGLAATGASISVMAALGTALVLAGGVLITGFRRSRRS